MVSHLQDKNTRPLEKDKDSQDMDSLELLTSLSFCVFDLETTGGNQSFDKIIEIGLIKIESLKIVKELSFLINPEIVIPEFIQKLTSIRSDGLKDAPIIENVLDQILEFMGDSILVAHNSSFDVPFFNSVLTRLGRAPLKNRVICTNLMTKYLIPDIMNSNLTYMSQIFDIPHNKAHRALEDARAAANLLLTFLNFFLEKKIRKINQLYYPRNKFELDRCHYRVQDSHSEILEIIKKAPSPLVISLKGDNGLLLAIFPLNKPAIEFSFVENLMKELPWHLITIKMVGPFFEGFLELNTQYSKMQKDIQDKILRHMYLTHFSKEPTPVAEDLFASFDFLITRHLIPEQYCIYPLMNLQGQNELVFRFPGHKKKFMQYITNQTRRFENMNKGLRKSCIIKPLWNFYGNYLLQLPKWPNNFAQTTLLSKNISKKDSEKFLQDFEDFSAKDLNPFGYPKNHI